MKIAYYEKLRDPRWQKKRLEVLARDQFTCQRCFSEDVELHVHHSLYDKKRDPWECDMKHLHSLCKDCHEEIEEILKTVRLALMHHPAAPDLFLAAADSVFSWRACEAYQALEQLRKRGIV